MSAVVASAVARRDDARAACGERNLLVTDPERDPVKDRCCHMPPRLGCALGGTEVQSSRGECLYLVYTQMNEHTFLSRTLRPVR